MHAIVGFIIILISFFTLPFTFLRRSWDELSEIGRKQSVDVDGAAELPFLSWLLVLGRSLVAIGAVLLYLFVVLAGAADDGDTFVLALLFGPVLSIAFIWVYGLLLEFISLQILVAKNTRLTYEAIAGTAATEVHIEPRPQLPTAN
jgi:hypothetical protein